MTVVWLSPQKTIFSTGTPVAAATVAPILATNTIPSATTAGKSAALLLLAGKNEACVVSCLFLSQRRPERGGRRGVSQLSPRASPECLRICDVCGQVTVEELPFFSHFRICVSHAGTHEYDRYHDDALTLIPCPRRDHLEHPSR